MREEESVSADARGSKSSSRGDEARTARSCAAPSRPRSAPPSTRRSPTCRPSGPARAGSTHQSCRRCHRRAHRPCAGGGHSRRSSRRRRRRARAACPRSGSGAPWRPRARCASACGRGMTWCARWTRSGPCAAGTAGRLEASGRFSSALTLKETEKGTHKSPGEEGAERPRARLLVVALGDAVLGEVDRLEDVVEPGEGLLEEPSAGVRVARVLRAKEEERSVRGSSARGREKGRGGRTSTFASVVSPAAFLALCSCAMSLARSHSGWSSLMRASKLCSACPSSRVRFSSFARSSTKSSRAAYERVSVS